MIPVLLLIIPFHGIFLSFFFFLQGEIGRGSNFYLGLMILFISLLSLFQQIPSPSTVNFSLPLHSFFQELMICPFLFLYTSTMMRSGLKTNMNYHAVIISITSSLIFMLNLLNGLTYNIIITSISLINIFYLIASLKKLIPLFSKDDVEAVYVQVSLYAWILILHALALGSLFLNLLICVLHQERSILLMQLPKGLIIYYTYYKILDKVKFVP